MSIKIKILSVLLLFASYAQKVTMQNKDVAYTFYALGNIGNNLDGNAILEGLIRVYSFERMY